MPVPTYLLSVWISDPWRLTGWWSRHIALLLISIYVLGIQGLTRAHCRLCSSKRFHLSRHMIWSPLQRSDLFGFVAFFHHFGFVGCSSTSVCIPDTRPQQWIPASRGRQKLVRVLDKCSSQTTKSPRNKQVAGTSTMACYKSTYRGTSVLPNCADSN